MLDHNCVKTHAFIILLNISNNHNDKPKLGESLSHGWVFLFCFTLFCFCLKRKKILSCSFKKTTFYIFTFIVPNMNFVET